MPRATLLALALLASGCLVAAAGAGAGGAIYVSDRGSESVLAAPVEGAYEATRQAFRDLGITEGKSRTEQEGSVEKRVLEGSTKDRDVTVTIQTRGNGSHVEVVARKSRVTWDKGFAKRILEKIVGRSSAGAPASQPSGR